MAGMNGPRSVATPSPRSSTPPAPKGGRPFGTMKRASRRVTSKSGKPGRMRTAPKGTPLVPNN